MFPPICFSLSAQRSSGARRSSFLLLPYAHPFVMMEVCALIQLAKQELMDEDPHLARRRADHVVDQA
jgi:hypothetical protein